MSDYKLEGLAIVPIEGNRLMPSIGAILLICDITGLAQCPPEKQISSHWPVETLCMSVAMILLSNKIDFSFCADMEGFYKSSYVFKVVKICIVAC